MSGKELLEAMSLVDDRFVEEAETAAVRKKPAWVKGCVAACAGLVACAVVFFGTGPVFVADRVGNSAPDRVETNTALESPDYHYLTDQSQATGATTVHPADVEMETPLFPQATAEPSYGGLYVQTFCTGGNGALVEMPRALVIASRAELVRYLAEQRGIAGADGMNAMEKALESYDEAFFRDNNLLLVCLETADSVARYTVTDLSCTEGQWQVAVREEDRSGAAEEIARWHLVLELHQSKDLGENQTAQVYIE